MPELTITAIARKAGLRTSTLRYYEKIGLLPSARRVAGRRRYDACALKQLELIAYAKRAGFSLAEIQILQESAYRGNPPAPLWCDLAKGKAVELDKSLSERRRRNVGSRRCRGVGAATLPNAPTACGMRSKTVFSLLGRPSYGLDRNGGRAEIVAD